MTRWSPDSIDASDVEDRRFGRRSPGGRALRELSLDALRRADGPLPLAEVACRVVADKSDRDPPVAPREEVQRVYLALVRYQIPQLEQRGVVEYSDDDGTVQLVGPGTP